MSANNESEAAQREVSKRGLRLQLDALLAKAGVTLEAARSTQRTCADKMPGHAEFIRRNCAA